MRPPLWIATVLFCSTPALLQDAARFSKLGISFEHPKAWKVSTETKYGVTLVHVKNAKGSQVTLHLHPAGTNPIGVRIQLERDLQQAHEGKLVEGSEQATTWKFSVGDQEGVALAFKDKEVIHHELYAFTLTTKKKQVCVVHFQHPASDAAEAKKAFAFMAESLGEEGAKPGVKLAPATPAVRLARPIPAGWELKPARKDAKLWSDRDYVFMQLPKDADGGLLVVRTAEDGKFWLAAERVEVLRNCTAFAMVRSRYMGQTLIDNAVLRKLARDGWKEILDPVSCSFPPGEGWGWRVIKLELTKGEEFPQLREMTWGQPTVFIFK